MANDGYDYGGRIAARHAGMTVVDYLSERYPHSSPREWRERLRAGRVLLQGRVAFADERLRPGQELVWRRPPWNEPPVPLGFALLFRDRHLLAVAKPAGLPTLPGGGYLSHTLLAIVRRHDPEAAPLHRLDRGTSGIVLFARTPEARARLAADWAEGRVRKTYRALCQGRPARDRFMIEAPIGPWPDRSNRPIQAAVAGGRPAVTRVEVLERRPGAALLEVTPATGRAHQIRIHLAVAGHPLVGEPLYAAGGVPAGGGRPGEGGFRLHALRLELPHPETGERLALECRPPAVLRRAGVGVAGGEDSSVGGGPTLA